MVGWLAQEGGPIEAVFGSSEKTALWVILGISIVALLFAWYLVREVLSAPEGSPKMREIAQAIQEGAKAYLSRQFRTLAVFIADLAFAHQRALLDAAKVGIMLSAAVAGGASYLTFRLRGRASS